jgi:hypothetical protein
MEENMDNIKLYLRWIMSEPIGDTMFKVSTDKDTQLDQKRDPHTPSYTVVCSPRAKVVGIEQENTEAEPMIT